MPKVSLIKPGTGSTQWGTNVGQNWTDIENTFKQALYQREVFEAVVRIPTLPVVAQAFAFRIGFGDSITGDIADGVYFELTQAGANWQCKTAR